MNTVLLTLGRLPKALELARAFHANGWRVIVAEPFRWHLSRVSRAVARSVVVTSPNIDRQAYLDELLALIEAESVDWVVPVSEDTLHASFLAPRLPPSVQLFAAPSEVLLTLHHKARFVQAMAPHRLPVPLTFDLSDRAQWPAAQAFAAHQPFVLKPVYSCSGIGVRLCEAGDPLPDPAGIGPEGLLLQQRVEGAVYSSFTLALEGEPRVTAVYRGALMSGTVAVCFERVDDIHPGTADTTQAWRSITAWVERFVRERGHHGFVSFDFIVGADGQAIAIECNPRSTSGLHFVDAPALVRAMIDPGGQHPVGFKPQRLFQQFFPCLTETQNAFGQWPVFRHHLALLRQAREVSWSMRDPLPLVTQPLTALNIILLARRKGVPYGEVATLDIGWYRDPDAPRKTGLNLPPGCAVPAAETRQTPSPWPSDGARAG